MKKIILSAVILTLGFAVKAQEIPERKHGEHRMHERGKRHHGAGMDMQKLNLTEEQKAAFKTQRENFRKQMEDLKKNENITVKESKEKMETLRKENKAKMNSILTKDQKDQLAKMQAERKEKFQDMAKKRGEDMKTRLGLTEEQSAKLDKNRTEMKEKMKAIKEDKKLSDEQKKEKVKELMKGQKESMKSILTEEQLQKLKESKHKKPAGRDGERKKAQDKQTI
jgi:colicin import membrane protein